ncbi:MAG: hypothetical protein Q4G13_01955 [Moraxella sp.]|nr:hypothetical protein [Moraxella sp.]
MPSVNVVESSDFKLGYAHFSKYLFTLTDTKGKGHSYLLDKELYDMEVIDSYENDSPSTLAGIQRTVGTAAAGSFLLGGEIVPALVSLAIGNSLANRTEARHEKKQGKMTYQLDVRFHDDRHAIIETGQAGLDKLSKYIGWFSALV